MTATERVMIHFNLYDESISFRVTCRRAVFAELLDDMASPEFRTQLRDSVSAGYAAADLDVNLTGREFTLGAGS